MIPLKNAEEIALMAECGRIVAVVLSELRKIAKAGVTTRKLDSVAEELIHDGGAEPSFKGYRGFPASICTSVNNEVVHGIPGKRVLKEGDIIGLDVGVKLNGYHGDAALTVAIEPISKEARKLMRVTLDALHNGVDAVAPGAHIGDVSFSIQRTVEAQGFSVVKSLAGHGIGREMHEEPEIPNFGRPGVGTELEPGMVLAIEPMVNAGSEEVSTLEDGWTVVTEDGSISAHYEHSVAVLEDGVQVLTWGWERSRGF